MPEHKDYPHITEAAIAMCACNGALNRLTPQEQLLVRLDYVLGAEGVYAEDLTRIDAWLATLTSDQLSVLVDGEETEMQALVAAAPEHTEGLMLDIYNELVVAT
jgi:hypothetical protein